MAFLMTNSRFPGGVTKKCQKVRNILYCFKDWIRVDGSRSIQQFLNKFFHLLQNFNVKVSSQPREADIDCLRKSSKWLEDPWAENWKFESQFYSRRWHTAHGVWRLKRQRTTPSLLHKQGEWNIVLTGVRTKRNVIRIRLYNNWYTVWGICHLCVQCTGFLTVQGVP